jgi:hypothetical protein
MKSEREIREKRNRLTESPSKRKRRAQRASEGLRKRRAYHYHGSFIDEQIRWARKRRFDAKKRKRAGR